MRAINEGFAKNIAEPLFFILHIELFYFIFIGI
ncbi:MAG: hypothetical protein H6Q70_3991 [Firmicutes bacterium]|nr:hypothetical protein [Bacillota bacterium]